MQKYGYNLQKIRALGCTDPEQAQRMGRYTLATNLRSTETVSFKVGPEGGLLLPGDVCLIGDPLKTRIQAGGRIVSATATKIVLDRDLTTGVDYTSDRWDLYIYTASGTAERSQVVAVSGNTVDVSGFNSVPSSNMLWVLVHSASNNNNDHRFNRYRIQKVSEQERGTYQVIAIKYDEAKYDYVNTASASYGSSKSLSKGKNKVLDISKISFKIRNP
jgi:predicted phage tail protein